MANEQGLIRVETTQRPGGAVAVLTIDNGRRANALNGALLRSFVEAVEGLSATDGLRAVVVTGAGRSFVGGADINEMAALDAEGARGFITLVHRACHAVRVCPLPVLARINGNCFGAGLELAASCDGRIAADTALLGMPEVRLGIPSVVEAAVLPGLIGWGRTRRLLLGGDTIGAATGERWGLLDEAVAADALDDACGRWLDAVLAGTPAAIAIQKRLIRQWEDLPLSEAVAAGIDAFAQAYATNEPRDAMGAFLRHRREAKAAVAGAAPGH